MLIEMQSRKTHTHVARRIALIVEDEPHLQRAMSEELRRMDFHVLVANHYQGALGHLAMGEPEVACIDVGLPNRSGYELCEHIRRSLRFMALPVIMTSEYGSPEDMAYAEDAGGNAFLHKPFSMLQLTRCVESLVNWTRFSAPPRHELQLLATGHRSAAVSQVVARRLQIPSAA